VTFLLNRSKNWSLWFFPILLGVGLIFLVFNGYQEVGKIKQLGQKRGNLIHFNQKLNWKNEEMYREVSRLKNDPVYLEEIARREFGLVKPDEIIFFLDEGHLKEEAGNVTGTRSNQRR